MGAKIPKVNSANEVIGETTITEARENGWPRRVSRAFIFNQDDQLLLQKRSPHVYTYPGRWDCCGGHVDVHESYAEAGSREINEELGIEITVHELAEPVFFEDTFYVVCKGVVDSNIKFTFNSQEVFEATWIEVAEFEEAINTNPDEYTTWIVHAWKKYCDTLITNS